jgi:parallel beta-helix repeat protein
MGNLQAPLWIAITSTSGQQRELSLNEQGSMFWLGDNVPVTLSIENVVLKGLSDGSDGILASNPSMKNTQPLVYVGQGNTFEMLGSAELTGNLNSGTNGGAVSVVGGTFLMTGNNTTISGNTAANGDGGGVYVDNSTFTMKAGFIYGEDAGTLINTANGAYALKVSSGTAVWPAGTTGYVGIASTTPLNGDIGSQDETVKAITP